MTDYYAKMLQEGLEFQDYCACEFAKIGIPITNFSSKKFQYTKGENLQGYEFKLDKNFRATGNLWIELKERTDIKNEYRDSGILRSDNTMFYVMGDFTGVYLMQKKVLIAMVTRFKHIENKIKTSIGFLLPTVNAEKYFNYIIFPKGK